MVWEKQGGELLQYIKRQLQDCCWLQLISVSWEYLLMWHCWLSLKVAWEREWGGGNTVLIFILGEPASCQLLLWDVWDFLNLQSLEEEPNCEGIIALPCFVASVRLCQHPASNWARRQWSQFVPLLLNSCFALSHFNILLKLEIGPGGNKTRMHEYNIHGVHTSLSSQCINQAGWQKLAAFSARAKMAAKKFVKCIFAIFATNASFLRVIANLQI